MFQTLIVEDNANFRHSLCELLVERFPCMTINEASTGGEGLTIFKLLMPQLIFMDIKLPDANGLDLTRTIRADDQRVIVVVLTAYDIPEYWDAAFQAGANYFVSKTATIGTEIITLVDSAFPTVCSTYSIAPG